MKTILIMCFCVLGLTVMASAQSPSTPAPVASPATVASPSVSPNSSPESDLERSIRNKHKHHFNFVVGKADVDDAKGVHDRGDRDDDDIPAMVIPIVAVVFLSIFGAPVLIVAVILYFGFSKSRMQHRTVRMMVEKGQPVPTELLVPPPPAQRQRSDMRRGIVLVMVGLGLMVLLGAMNNWKDGTWAIGIIPFLIGAGYLLVWKLEGKNGVPPPPPVK